MSWFERLYDYFFIAKAYTTKSINHSIEEQDEMRQADLVLLKLFKERLNKK
jgi:hypothetical protein